MQVKFDLNDWQGRRARLIPILNDAAQAGLVPAGSTEKLSEFLLGRGVGVAAEAVAVDPNATGLDTPRANEPPRPSRRAKRRVSFVASTTS